MVTIGLLGEHRREQPPHLLESWYLQSKPPPTPRLVRGESVVFNHLQPWKYVQQPCECWKYVLTQRLCGQGGCADIQRSEWTPRRGMRIMAKRVVNGVPHVLREFARVEVNAQLTKSLAMRRQSQQGVYCRPTGVT